ncbi:MAG TPA: PEP-CTERM sorting domain-containing protein [Malonomonas sp.]
MKALRAAVFFGVTLFFGAMTAADATQFSMTSNDISTSTGYAAEYLGAGGNPGYFNNSLGVVNDGGDDAYDGMGYLSNLGSLAAVRHTEAIASLNLYRWLDKITNPTATSIQQRVYWWGNLGSDGDQTIHGESQFSAVTHDIWGHDPDISFVWGNNGFAADNMTFSYFNLFSVPSGVDFIQVAVDLVLDPGESVSLLFFSSLTKDLTDRSGDLDLALSKMLSLVDNPYLDGLSQAERNGIANYGFVVVPEPVTLLLFGCGFVGLAWYCRHRNMR